MPLAAGTRLGPYEVLAPIGAGGMGEVYKARDTRLGRLVALKVSHERFSERFEREARAAAALNHPHICQLYDVGPDYLVMEFLEGETLAARIARGALPLDQALQLAIQMADALAHAHRQGVVHRDLKPANVMLTKSGAKLLDFGLARMEPRIPAGPETVSMAITTPGTILGTFQYMAPEQLEAKETDARTDLFAYGALLYEMLAGRRAFEAESQASLIAAILGQQPQPLSAVRPHVPPRLDRAIRTCLEKDPAERWQSARDLLRELRWIAEETAQGPASPARSAVAPSTAAHWTRRAWIPAGASAVVLIGAVLWRTAPGASAPAAPSGPPVVVLMDSADPPRVYDPATLKSGGTNADDITDVLHGLPVSLVKETASSLWHREDQVLKQNPAMIVIHRSCFFEAPKGLPDSLDDDVYALADSKLVAFLGYIALGNPRTKFFVYSRRSWDSEADAAKWRADAASRFPALAGKIETMRVPLDRATFRNPQTGGELRERVVSLLDLKAAQAKAR